MTDLPEWVRDLLERLVRNLVQALTPALVLLSTSGQAPDVGVVAGMMLAVVILTLLKYLVGLSAGPGEPWYVQVLDRVASAGAAGLLAFIPAGWDGSMSEIDWVTAGWSALGAAGIALVMLYATPPSQGDPARHLAT